MYVCVCMWYEAGARFRISSSCYPWSSCGGSVLRICTCPTRMVFLSAPARPPAPSMCTPILRRLGAGAGASSAALLVPFRLPADDTINGRCTCFRSRVGRPPWAD